MGRRNGMALRGGLLPPLVGGLAIVMAAGCLVSVAGFYDHELVSNMVTPWKPMDADSVVEGYISEHIVPCLYPSMKNVVHDAYEKNLFHHNEAVAIAKTLKMAPVFLGAFKVLLAKSIIFAPGLLAALKAVLIKSIVVGLGIAGKTVAVAAIAAKKAKLVAAKTKIGAIKMAAIGAKKATLVAKKAVVKKVALHHMATKATIVGVKKATIVGVKKLHHLGKVGKVGKVARD